MTMKRTDDGGVSPVYRGGSAAVSGLQRDRQAQTVLAYLLLVYATVYVALAAAGAYTFIYKSMLVPAFAVYAIATRDVGAFVRAWFPFLAATVLFDALRGGIYRLVQLGYRPRYAQYAIDLELWVTGTPAICLPLQEHLRAPLMDSAMVIVHGGHFVYFLLFGLVVWHGHRDWFARYKWAMIGIFYAGALCYALVPTVPPWMAAELGLIPHVEHITRGVYNLTVPELYGTFDTNPVAAMPSLHAAFPAVCMVIAWRAFSRRAALAATVYALLVGFSIMYLGEHYLVDVLAGYVLAFVAAAVVLRVDPPREPARLRTALAWAVLLAGLAFAIAAAGGW